MRRRQTEPAAAAADDQAAPIESTLASTPELIGAIEAFVAGLGGRIEVIERSLAADDLESVAQEAQRLKGSAAGYGFPSIMAAAANLEASARAAEALWQITGRVRTLVALCRRARSSRTVASAP